MCVYRERERELLSAPLSETYPQYSIKQKYQYFVNNSILRHQAKVTNKIINHIYNLVVGTEILRPFSTYIRQKVMYKYNIILSKRKVQYY